MAAASLVTPVCRTAAVLSAIERFVQSAREPALLEPGEPALPLLKNCFLLDPRSSHVLLQAWDDSRNLARKVIAVGVPSGGRLALTAQLFGGRTGSIELLDLASPCTAARQGRGRKLVFRERFRQMLQREYPHWRIAELSADPDLEHSLSPAFPRALLRHGSRSVAAIAAPPESPEPAHALTFGLIWLEHLRSRERKGAPHELLIFAPAGAERVIAQRLRFLDGDRARYLLHCFSGDGFAPQVEWQDLGNVETQLEQCRLAPGVGLLPPGFARVPGFEATENPDGSAHLRVFGMSFGTWPSRNSPAELLAHARELSRLRSERGSLLHSKDPERWLESNVRQDVEALDAFLLPHPLYGQVPAFSAGERGVVDLLAANRNGRLAVVELKATADIHLPLQALDYWIRVAHHARAGEFTSHGYFPGLTLSPTPPQLILAAPALEFHPSTEILLKHFSPAIEVQRIGFAPDWRDRLRVMFRFQGAARAA